LPRINSHLVLRAFETVGLGALVLVWIVVALVWRVLPTQVPVHFGLDGRPDAWGAQKFILVLPALALLTFLTRAPKSVPIVAQVFSAVLRAIILVGFAWSTIGGVRIARGKADGLGEWFAPCLFLSIVATGVWFGLRSKKSRSGSAA